MCCMCVCNYVNVGSCVRTYVCLVGASGTAQGGAHGELGSFVNGDGTVGGGGGCMWVVVYGWMCVCM